MTVRINSPAHQPELAAAHDAHSTSSSSLGRKLAALAGVTGAMTASAEAGADVIYTPTAGVVAAQGIPGFSFVDASNVTLGELRGSASSPSFLQWDPDGDGTADFSLGLASNTGQQGVLSAYPGNALRFDSVNNLSNVPDGQAVNATGYWIGGSLTVTFGQSNFQTNFTTDVSGQIGFFFKTDGETYYGWGSLVIDLQAVGEGFKITEAYYQSTPGTAINVGAVPVAVPEPASLAFYSNMALLTIGSAGVRAWRARRGQGC